METDCKSKDANFFIKTKKYKSKLRFRFFCWIFNQNNKMFQNVKKGNIEYLTAFFHHSYKGITIYCEFSILAINIKSFLAGESALENTSVGHQGKQVCIEFKIDDSNFGKYLKMDYAEIPQKIEIMKHYKNRLMDVEAKMKVVCDKNPFLQLIGYQYKIYPKTYKRGKRVLTAYNNVSKLPVMGGTFSSR